MVTYSCWLTVHAARKSYSAAKVSAQLAMVTKGMCLRVAYDMFVTALIARTERHPLCKMVQVALVLSQRADGYGGSARHSLLLRLHIWVFCRVRCGMSWTFIPGKRFDVCCSGYGVLLHGRGVASDTYDARLILSIAMACAAVFLAAFGVAG